MRQLAAFGFAFLAVLSVTVALNHATAGRLLKTFASDSPEGLSKRPTAGRGQP
jgi:hypothetical protein